MTDTIPTPHIESPNTGRFGPAALVWLVPLAALIVAGFVTFRTVSERGPQITISFAEASGVTEGETEVKFRDVSVGVVEKVSFTEDLDRVLVTVRLDNEVADFADDDAEFWIVTPEVTTRGISGLNTVLSGVFIEANWDNRGEGLITSFIGSDRAPLSVRDRGGLSFMLTSQREGGLQPNTPILYKGIEVGRVGEPRITDDRTGVEAEAYIIAEHAGLITTATRFWDISGVRFTLGPSGAGVDFDSIASLLSGGISFQTIISGGEPPEPGTVFEVFPDEGTARNSVFETDISESINFSLIFDQNVSGLETGAAVELNGIRVGEIINLTGLVDEALFGDTRVRLVAVAEISLGRLGLAEGSTDQDAFDLLQDKVENENLRARLTNASLLTGGLKVELTRIDDAVPDRIVLAEPFAIFPTAAAAVDDVTASAEDVLRRVESLPVEELFESAISVLDNAAQLLRNEDLNGTPAVVRSILDDVNDLTGSAAIQRLPDEVQTLITALQGASEGALEAISDMRGIVADTRAAGLPERVGGAIDAASRLTTEISTATQGVPALLAQLEGLAAEARTIPFPELSARLDSLLASADGFLSDEALAALPAEVAATLTEAQTLAADLRGLVASDAVQALPPQAQSLLTDLQGAVTDLRTTLDTANTTAADVSTALTDVPALISEFQALAAEARTIPFPELSARLDSLLASADGFLSDEALAALPAEVAATLTEAQTLAADLRGLVASDAVQALPPQAQSLLTDLQGAVTDLRTTLDTANTTAADVSTALTDVPALISEFQALAAEARTIPFPELSARLDSLLASADGFLSDEALAALPAEVAATLTEAQTLAADLRGLVASDAVQALPPQAQSLLTDLQGAVTDLRTTLDTANTTAADVSTALTDVPALISEFQALAAEARTIPFPELSARLDSLLASADGFLSDEALAALPAEVAATLTEAQTLAADLRGLVASDAVQALPPQAQSLLTDLQGAVTDLRTTLDTANTTAADVSTAMTDVPALISEFQALAAEARTIPFPELSARLDSLLASADGFLSDEALAALPAEVAATLTEAQTLAADLRGLVASDAVQALPERTGALLGDMQAAVAELRTTLSDFQSQGAVDRLVEAVDATTEAAEGVTASVAGLPDLIAELQAVAGEAGDLPLAELTAELSETLDAAQTILTDAETRALPGTLNVAIANLGAVLTDIREGGAIDNVNAALSAAEGAATAVETATTSLPALIRNANAVLAQANATLAALDGSSELSREARGALREVSRAASAVSSLARALERRPNSILLGR